MIPPFLTLMHPTVLTSVA